MKGDIKRKFIDILFEPDEKEELDEESFIEERVSKKPLTKDDVPISAKDILYRKSGQSAFIDLDETLNKVSEQEDIANEYELSAQISPIFGVIRETRRVSDEHKTVNESQVNKPEDSHLEIITSPIYGYGTREDQTTETDDVARIFNDDNELHQLLDNNDVPYYDDHTYDDFDEADELNLFNYGEDE